MERLSSGTHRSNPCLIRWMSLCHVIYTQCHVTCTLSCVLQGDCPQILQKVRGQADGIAHLAWSPDDAFLLSCGREDSPEAIVFNTQVSVCAA